MMSYEITDDEINWKKETDTDTTVSNATASVAEKDKLWSKYDWSGENKTGATLRHNVASALKLSHSRYSKLKRLTYTQQDEKDTIELGMLSIMQMHYSWVYNFSDFRSPVNQKNVCRMYQVVRTNTPATASSRQPQTINKRTMAVASGVCGC